MIFTEHYVIIEYMKTYDVQSSTLPSHFATHLTTRGDSGFMHNHDYYEIVYIISGSIEHICNNLTEVLKKSDAMILRPGDVHDYKRIDPACIHRDIMVPTELFAQVCGFLDPGLAAKIDNSLQPVGFSVDDAHIGYFENIFGHIYESAGKNTEPMIKGALTSVLSTVLMQKSMSPPPSLWFLDLITRFKRLEYVRGGISKILEDISYSQIYICRIFKKHMGCTITEHLNTVRLNCAESFLTTTNLSVSQIADEVGYNSLSYFTNMFKKAYGMAPHQYRLKAATRLNPPPDDKK